MSVNPLYKNLIIMSCLLSILALSSMGVDRYNKNNEDNKSMMTLSVVGLVFSIMAAGSLGYYIISGGKEKMFLAESRYNQF
jgi:hypothetical protein